MQALRLAPELTVEGQKLTERVAQLIVRRMSTKDIADRLGTSEARIERILARMRKRRDRPAEMPS